MFSAQHNQLKFTKQFSFRNPLSANVAENVNSRKEMAGETACC
jgi:hypothetical protein